MSWYELPAGFIRAVLLVTSLSRDTTYKKTGLSMDLGSFQKQL